MTIRIGDLITWRIVKVDAGETVSKAAKLMSKENVGSLLVTDNGMYTGILSERDLVSKVVAQEMFPGDVKVGDVMSTPIITLPYQENVEKAAKLMRKKDIRRLGVVDGDRMVGILTETDFTRKVLTLL